MLAITPIVRDEIIGGDGNRYFDIGSDKLNPAMVRALIIPVSPTIQKGTEINGAFMNNRIDFSHLKSFQGCIYNLTGDTPNSYQMEETITIPEDSVSNLPEIIVAKRITKKISKNFIEETEIIYDINRFNELVELVHRETTYEKLPNGEIEVKMII